MPTTSYQVVRLKGFIAGLIQAKEIINDHDKFDDAKVSLQLKIDSVNEVLSKLNVEYATNMLDEIERSLL